jgi:hypothetical protein
MTATATTSNQVQPLPIINASYTNSHAGGANLIKQNGYYFPRNHIKPLPFATTTNTTAVVNNNNGLMINNNNNSNSRRNNVHQLAPLANRQNGGVGGTAVAATTTTTTNTSEVWTRPRIITIIRATERPRSKISILLNRRAVYNYEQLVCDISNAFGLPQWRNDKIRKLYSLKGKRIQGISDFYRDDDTFLGVSGKEPLTGRLIKDILQELYPNEDEQAAGLFKEWEASRTARSKPKHATSMEQVNSKPADDNNGSNAAAAAAATDDDDTIKKITSSHSNNLHHHYHKYNQHNQQHNAQQNRITNHTNNSEEIEINTKKKSMPIYNN